MDGHVVGAVLESHDVRLVALGARGASAFLAVCAWRLIGCVERFLAGSTYPGVVAARRRLDEIQTCLEAGGTLPGLLTQTELEETPHADDHPTFVVVAIHAFVIDVDVASRALVDGVVPAPGEIVFALEPFLARATHDTTGYCTFGDVPIAPETRREISQHAVLASEIAFQQQDIGSLEREGTHAGTYRALRARAAANRWAPERLVPDWPSNASSPRPRPASS